MMKIKQRINGLIYALILLHLIWFVASFLLAKPILPNPVEVYRHFPLLFSKGLGLHILASLKRIFIGLGLSLFFGALLGISMGKSVKWNRLMDPIIYLTYPIPKLALLPMVMVLFGLGEVSKIVLIVLIIFPQVVLSVRDAVLDVPEELYHIYDCIQATPWQKLKNITLPATYSAVLSTSRISLGTAISVLFFTENYGTEFGMGYYIMDAWLRMDYPMMYGGILVLSSIGFILFLLIDLLGIKEMKWKK